MKKSIVTGGAGFIGSHLVDLLIEHNHEVVIIDNLASGNLKNIEHLKNTKSVCLIESDINNIESNNKDIQNADFVFHLAGLGDIVPSIENPTKYFYANYFGTLNLLEALKDIDIKKFVYAASSSCYGIADIPTNENNKIDPKYPYALSKYQAEQLIFHWHKVYGLKANSIRIFNAYGTRSRTTGAYGAVIGTFLKQKLSDHPFTVVGDGNQRRDFIYVTDLAKAFLKAAEIEDIEGEVFNVGNSNPRSINELVSLLQGEVIFIPKRPGEPEITHADITKAKNLLNWQPEISLEDGIKLVLKEIEYWQEAPLWTPEKIEIETQSWFKYLS
tara:strand:- start:1085 stop:2071 length:987 start_codon:yes stop_codon:yes gene_type:complete